MELFYILTHYFLIFKGVSLWLRLNGLCIKSSICHSGWLSLCIIYCVYKILFLCKLSSYTIYADLVIDFCMLVFICKKHCIPKTFEGINAILRKIRIIHLIFILPLMYGLFLAVLLSPTTYDVNTYHVSRIILLEQQNSYFLKSFNNICEIIYGFGYDLVLHNHLRFGLDRGLAIYGYISFLCIIGFLYNFTDDQNKGKFVRFFPCLLFISLIEPAYQSLSAKNDLPGVLACLASYHAYSKWKYSPQNLYFILSLSSLAWAVSCKKVYLAFALPMVIIWGITWFKKNQSFKISPLNFLWGSIILFFLSPAITYVYNIFLWGNWSGPTYFTHHHSNNSLFIGTIGNFFRYLFEIIHLPHFVDQFLQSSFTFSPVALLNDFWLTFFYPWIGNAGESNMPFFPQWEQLEDSWFGPVGILLFILFFLRCFSKKIAKEKEILFLILTYLFLLCFMLSWRPHNDRYFTLFFTFCSLFAGINKYDFLLSSKFRLTTFTCAIFFLNWSVFFNKNSPTFNFASLNIFAMCKDAWSNGVLAQTNFGKKKFGYPSIPSEIIDQINPSSKIAIWSDEFIPIPSLPKLKKFKIQSLKFYVSKNFAVTEVKDFSTNHLKDSAYLLHFGNSFPLSKHDGRLKKIWRNELGKGKSWSLFRVNT